MRIAETVTLIRLSSGVPVQTIVYAHEPVDGTDGPTLYVQAAQHGRETNGAEVLRRPHGHLERAELPSRAVAAPVADPLTLDRVSYVTPEAFGSVNPNMGRAWPGDPDGSLHQCMAATLWEYISDADAIVDLHTGSPDMFTHTVYLRGDEESRNPAWAFGVDILLAEAAGDKADDEWTERSFDGKLRVVVTNVDVSSITPELAHSKQLAESTIVTGVEGVLNVYRDMGILLSVVEPRDGRTYRSHLGRVQAVASGLSVVREDAELAREIRPGDRLGWMYDPTIYEVLQEVEAEHAGLVYSIAHEATVTAGETLVGIALPLDDGEGDDEEDDPFDEADGDLGI